MLSKENKTYELLIEFLSEELPPINLEKNIGESFATNLINELKNFIQVDSFQQFFVTPRRFGCIISQVYDTEPTQQQKRKGPAIATSLINDNPTNTLLGFLKSNNLNDWTKLEQGADGYFYTTKNLASRSLNQVLPNAIQNALKKLPIAKNMRWSNNDYSFVRPIHNLLILYNNQPICQNSSILGCSPVDYTFGHRIMSNGMIKITTSHNYTKQMLTEGFVVTDFQYRRALIDKNLHQQGKALSLDVNTTTDQLNEVTALVEYPVVLQGEFSPKFLKIPQECLILSMTQHQKYFALLDSTGKLSNKFLFVANIASPNPEVIINGNQKVLASRLADAKFFYEVDLKHNLIDFVKMLDNVVYHNKLGSQLQRVKRLQIIASNLAPALGVDKNLAEKSAYLLKADLGTAMVREFPQLQGIMGKYYAITSNYGNDIANAIEQHYYPRFSGDALPDTALATIMSLTDKLEMLVGLWGIGAVPTGEKDPFALRRAALGVSRIILNHNLNLTDLLNKTFASFTNLDLNKNTLQEVYKFILDRLNNYLINIKGFNLNSVNAVLKSQVYEYDNKTCNFSRVLEILPIVQNIANNPQNKKLFEANKRIENILRKNATELPDNLECISELIPPYGQELFKFLSEFKQFDLRQDDFNSYFYKLTKATKPLASFFDNVMVMDDNPKIRKNNLSLLKIASQRFGYICKLSELS